MRAEQPRTRPPPPGARRDSDGRRHPREPEAVSGRVHLHHLQHEIHEAFLRRAAALLKSPAFRAVGVAPLDVLGRAVRPVSHVAAPSEPISNAAPSLSGGPRSGSGTQSRSSGAFSEPQRLRPCPSSSVALGTATAPQAPVACCAWRRPPRARGRGRPRSGRKRWTDDGGDTGAAGGILRRGVRTETRRARARAAANVVAAARCLVPRGDAPAAQPGGKSMMSASLRDQCLPSTPATLWPSLIMAASGFSPISSQKSPMLPVPG